MKNELFVLKKLSLKKSNNNRRYSIGAASYGKDLTLRS